MGTLVVVALGLLAFGLLVALVERWRNRPRSRTRRNAYAKWQYRRAGFHTYPHELVDGSYVWQSVWHDDAMDDGCAAAA